MQRTHDALGLTVPPAFLANWVSPCAEAGKFLRDTARTR